MDEYQEHRIAAGLRKGRREAWQRLYDAHAERVWWLVARAMSRDSSDVADVVQETLLAVAKSARSYDASRGSLSSWLNGIARRQIALYYRRRKRHHALSSSDLSSTDYEPDDVVWADEETADPAAVASRAELASQVRATLTKLPADYEVLLTSKYVDGASVEEIAASEKASEEAIRSKLARARRAFRKKFPLCPKGQTGGHHGS